MASMHLALSYFPHSYVSGLASLALAPALAYDINLAGCFLSALVPALSIA